MKKLTIGFLITISVFRALAQAPTHVPLMNSYWDVLSMKSYKKNSNGVYGPYFPPDLAELNNKTVELPGYMIPIKAGVQHQVFMLSVLPVLQCQFCGQADIPSMAEVHMLVAVPYSENPILIKGTLKLNSTDNAHSEFIILNATLEKLE
jgi:hypothetical protein